MRREVCINVKFVITPAKGENKWHLAFINAYIITITQSHLHVDGLWRAPCWIKYSHTQINVLIDRRRARAHTDSVLSHMDRQVSSESTTSHCNIVFGSTSAAREHKQRVQSIIWIDRRRARAQPVIAISCLDRQVWSESTTIWVTRTRKREAARGILGT